MALAVLTVASTTAVWAHPLGNFTTNTSAAITVRSDGISVAYVVDLAEVPTFRVRRDLGLDGRGTDADAATRRWAADECTRLGALVHVDVDRTRRPLRSRQAVARFTAGQAGLPTMRVECAFATAAVDLTGTHRVDAADAAYPDRSGWREMTAVGDGVTIAERDVPARSPSDRLRAYPEEELSAPVDQRRATLHVRPGPVAALADAAGAPDAVVSRVDGVAATLSDLVAARDLTIGLAASALAVALALGAMHALAPGHGKTVMAAYLVGRRGTTGQAVGLGAVVAVTHTLGVVLLGAVLSSTQAVAPERIYPWLGAASGLLFTGIGLGLLWRARRGGHAHAHGHGHGHGEGHDADHGTRPADRTGPHDHAHDSDVAHGHGLTHEGHGHDDPALTWRALALPGLAGGLVPSPSALLVLLAGIALGRAWFGVALVVAYGVGMAVTLVGAGWLLLQARDRVDAGRLRWTARFAAVLPMVTAALIVVGGLVITARSLSAI